MILNSIFTIIDITKLARNSFASASTQDFTFPFFKKKYSFHFELLNRTLPNNILSSLVKHTFEVRVRILLQILSETKLKISGGIEVNLFAQIIVYKECLSPSSTTNFSCTPPPVQETDPPSLWSLK